MNFKCSNFRNGHCRAHEMDCCSCNNDMLNCDFNAFIPDGFDVYFSMPATIKKRAEEKAHQNSERERVAKAIVDAAEHDLYSTNIDFKTEKDLNYIQQILDNSHYETYKIQQSFPYRLIVLWGQLVNT